MADEVKVYLDKDKLHLEANNRALEHVEVEYDEAGNPCINCETDNFLGGDLTISPELSECVTKIYFQMEIHSDTDLPVGRHYLNTSNKLYWVYIKKLVKCQSGGFNFKISGEGKSLKELRQKVDSLLIVN